MFWADRVAKEIIKSGKHKPYWVDDMKTPSGRIHVGSLRGVVVHDLIYRALVDANVDATFSYVFEDHDPMDDLPKFLDKNKWSKHLGKPLFTIPSPYKGAKNYAQYFAKEFEEVFNKIGSRPKIIWVSTLYKTGKMNDSIKTCLDSADVIGKIYEEIYKKKIPSNWYPFQPVCLSCGKESTTKVNSWDGKEVEFECRDLDWVRGCGFRGKASPFSTKKRYAGKLPWKVEWAVKWKVIGITIEGAGKDHMTKGGSHDVSSMVCKRVLNYPVPYPFMYEFFLVGGKKMSSSKGRGSSAKEISEILPPYLLRFLMVRSKIHHAIDFDPDGFTIPDLFDEYDRCFRAYTDDLDKDLARIFELSQITDEKIPKSKIYIPRFRTVSQVVQFSNVDEKEYFSKEKGSNLTGKEIEILRERVKYSKIWLEKYAPEDVRFSAKEKLPKEAENLSKNQRKYLAKVAELFKTSKKPDKLQKDLYETAKNMEISTKDAFNAIYLSFLGKPHGPKAAWFLQSLPKDFVIKRLLNVQSSVLKKEKYRYPILDDARVFSIDPKVSKRFPSITIGLAIIKNVTIKKTDKKLQKEIDEFVQSISGLTTKELGKFPEVKSYRKIYKETGVDWHSRRPSPEALLRRIALKKGLYSINTCVDAYNLVVMRNRVSSGAFNLDAITFPTVLRFAKEGEEICLLGDKESTKYKEGEIAYFDEIGGFNIDFNFRDAKRTMITEDTVNIWINIDGVYDVTREKVEKTLFETIEIITKYCGGKVELVGVVTANKS